ncbi:MAG: hypothetical protein K0R26_699 [Bacteroidota bacterium]|nr:hypothetical protein [Bacteroidota bacterium]
MICSLEVNIKCAALQFYNVNFAVLPGKQKVLQSRTIFVLFSGEGGIRTLGTVTRTHV